MWKFLLLLPLSCVVNAKFRFDNYTLYKVLPNRSDQIEVLQNLQNNDVRYDFWTDPVNSADFVSILSSPENRRDLENLLNGKGIKFEITMPNIQEAIDKEKVNTYTRGNFRSMGWDGYYTNDQINTWIDDLAAAYPDTVTPLVGGTSFEGRPIRGLRISHGEGKRVIFLEGGIHSREWISPAVVCYITAQLLTSDDEVTRKYAEEYDWYIFPVTNPDGYVWSHDVFRMWRKNRRPIGSNFGVDLNRNWNHDWLVTGASTNPASDTYAGLGPFSEPETRGLSSFIRSIGDRIDIYLSFHSFGQLLLIPFGNSTQPYANYYDTMNVGRRAMGALSVRYGTQYVTGNIAEAIYSATGGSIDWVKDHVQVPVVYCYELRDKVSFLLPPDQILPSGEETMDSLLDMIYQAKRFGLINAGHGLTSKSFVMSRYFWLPDGRIPLGVWRQAIDKEKLNTYTRGNFRSMGWDGYYTNDQINTWIDDLAAAYPDTVTPLVGGTSFEGRPIRGLRISHGEGKRVIFLEGGIHSREWISPAVVCYITAQLLTSDDEVTRKYAEEYDWYIFPVTNPDGYVWSHDVFRMWRKNRRPIGSNFGVDLNRNWNHDWLVTGASTNPASDTYAGLGPFSEPETRGLSSFIRSIGDRIDIYLSFHSFGQLLLIPFGNSTQPYANYYDTMNVGRRAMGALSVRYGTQYVTGNIAEAIYSATGGSIDWVKDHVHVPVVYCYELRDKVSFLLPPDQILPSGEETMDSLLDMIYQAKRFGLINAGHGLASKSFVMLIALGIALIL